MWRTKGQLRAEVENLHTQQQHMRAILQAVMSHDHCRQVLKRLRQGESAASMAKTLPRSIIDEVSYGSRSPSAMSPGASETSDILDECMMVESPENNSHGDMPPEKLKTGAADDYCWKQLSGANMDADDDTDASLTSLASPDYANTVYSPNSYSATTPATDVESSRRVSAASRSGAIFASVSEWTSVTKDVSLIRELIKLYFTWEHPIFSLVCKDPFIKDFEDEKRRYCSSALVNAMISLACRFLDFSNARLDWPQLSDRFFHEAKQHLADSKEVTLPNVQALGLLSLRETVWGRQDKSMRFAEDCAKMALAMNTGSDGSDLADDAEYRTVRGTTICGAFSLCR